QKELGVTTIMVTHDQEEALSVADRIVVMNHGVIEQVGTPQQVYSEPTTAFVADFVGRVNRIKAVAGGDGTLRCGQLRLPWLPSWGAELAPGATFTLYLRPEDRVLEGLTGAHPHQCVGIVRRVDFLGGNCLAEMQVEVLAEQSIHLQFSLNQMRDFDVREGATVRFALRAERLRAFVAPPG
ncbi:MAG: TOBE domain-containing protein, partial [Rhizobiales bacterium]|nr:TOBE domain-containing protein [Rhizobacter sp.]